MTWSTGGEYTAIPNHATVPNGSRICSEEIPAHASVMCMYLNINAGMALTGDHTMCNMSLLWMQLPLGTTQYGQSLMGSMSVVMKLLADCVVPNRSRVCCKIGNIAGSDTVPNGSNVCSGEIASEWAVHKVNCFCGKEMLVECAVPNGSRICGDEITVHALVPNGGHVFGETNKIHGNPMLP
jgi:hypothetical protein